MWYYSKKFFIFIEWMWNLFLKFPPSLRVWETELSLKLTHKLNLIKLIIMARELTASAQAILDALVEKGISEDKVERFQREGVDIVQNELPASGKFEFDLEKHLAGEGEFTHLRVGVAGTDKTVSTANIQIVAPEANGEIIFREITREDSDLKGMKYLAGSPLNPKLSKYSPVELVDYLNGKSFTAREVKVRQLPYKKDGWSEPTAADTVVKTAYRITLR